MERATTREIPSGGGEETKHRPDNARENGGVKITETLRRPMFPLSRLWRCILSELGKLAGEICLRTAALSFLQKDIRKSSCERESRRRISFNDSSLCRAVSIPCIRSRLGARGHVHADYGDVHVLTFLRALGLRPGSYGSSTAQAITFHFACSLAHNSRRAGDCSSP